MRGRHARIERVASCCRLTPRARAWQDNERQQAIKAARKAQLEAAAAREEADRDEAARRGLHAEQARLRPRDILVSQHG